MLKVYKNILRAEKNKEAVMLLLIRLCVLSLALLTSTFYLVYFDNQTSYSLELIYTFIAILFGFCALSGFWLLANRNSTFVCGIQFLFDSLLITAVIYMTGGANSTFHFMYLPVVLGAAIFMTRNWAIALSVLNTILYTSLTLAIFWNYIPAFIEQAKDLSSLQEIILQTIGLSSAMILTSIVTTKIRSALHISEAIATKSHRYIQELHEHREVLLAQIPQAVFTLDESGIIVHCNQAALTFCKLEKLDIVGSYLKHVLDTLFVDCKLNLHSLPTNANFSFNTHNGEKHTYNVTTQSTLHGIESGNTITIMFRDITQLLAVERQLELQEKMLEIQRENEDYTNPLPSELSQDFIGKSQVMQKVFSLIVRVAGSDASVLISGESGTGKELAAKAIHLQSTRKLNAFVAINCGAFPDNLLESELFGHKKGAFTGAYSDHQGLFQKADGGTIFLDEIGELPLHMQTKLLRVLQERVVRPVGSNEEFSINVRVISATNRNLKHEVEQGSFREDLYYRLHVIGIQLPALRERIGDIPLLIENFTKKLCKDSIAPVISAEAMEALLNYHYPGNVRELENILEQALVLADQSIELEQLPTHIKEKQNHQSVISNHPTATQIIVDNSIEFPLDLDLVLQNLEKQYLVKALQQTNGVKKKAAEILGINFRSFRYRLQKFDISGVEDQVD